jgi:hypothetical protein
VDVAPVVTVAFVVSEVVNAKQPDKLLTLGQIGLTFNVPEQ